MVDFGNKTNIIVTRGEVYPYLPDSVNTGKKRGKESTSQVRSLLIYLQLTRVRPFIFNQNDHLPLYLLTVSEREKKDGTRTCNLDLDRVGGVHESLSGSLKRNKLSDMSNKWTNKVLNKTWEWIFILKV